MGWVPKLHPVRSRPDEGLVLLPHSETRREESDGPGDALKAALGRLGIWSRTNCRCDIHVRAMNVNGLAWCEANVGTIADWLKEGAKERGLPFVRWTAERFVRVVLWRHGKQTATRHGESA